jgi:hypothetical protein
MLINEVLFSIENINMFFDIYLEEIIWGERKIIRTKRIFIWVSLVASLLLVITGCSMNQQEIFKAAMKMQDVNSEQVHTTMTLKLSGVGLEPKMQQQVDTAAVFLNNAKLDFKVKTKGNEQKTVNQTQVDMNLLAPGLKLNVPIWVDSDLTGDTPKLTEIIKLPQIAKTSLPQQYAAKDYLVMSPLDMNNPEFGSFDAAKLMELSNSFRDIENSFLRSYSKRFNPNFDTFSNSTVYMTTDDGGKLVRRYEIRLDDKQFKDLIRYSVNNFVQDKEAMNFMKSFIDLILQTSQTTSKKNDISEFDKAFQEFDAGKQKEFLTNFNNVMDRMKDVTILGDKGLDLQYYIYNGYIIQESGAIDVKVTLDKMAQFIRTLNGQQSSAVEPQGTMEMVINFNTDISGINAPNEINFPEVNKDNSFNITEMSNLSKVKEKN